MQDKYYDIAIIGAGPAGYKSSLLLADKGYQVVLIEKENIGGICLNEGCIPTKFLLQKAKDFKKMNKKITDTAIEKWINEKNILIQNLSIHMKAEAESKGIEIIRDEAIAIEEQNEKVTVRLKNGKINASKIIFAIGSKENMPRAEGIEEGITNHYVLNSSEILSYPKVIPKLLIIGAGIIGFEFASYWSMLGSDVTIIEKQKEFLPELDQDIKNYYVEAMKKQGIQILEEAQVLEIDAEEKCVFATHDRKKILVEPDKILVATGRKSILEQEKKWNNCLSGKRIHKIGDCKGKLLLATTAYEEAKVLVNLLDGKNDSVDYELIPRVIYSNPEVAWAGKSERMCEKQDISCHCYKKSMNYSSKYLVENGKEQGLCKLIFKNDSKTIIGAQIVGNGACELISFIKLAIEKNMKKEELERFTFPHPSVSEIVSEVIK